MFGKLKQIPPIYSALKVNGKKLYEYARSGQEVEIKEREVEIFSIRVDSINYEENEILFTVNCSKGTYIRTLCEQIAEKIGTIGYMKSLERTKVNDFNIRDALSLEELENSSIPEVENKIIPIEKIFEKNDSIKMTHKGIELFKNGVMLTYNLSDGIYRVYNENIFVGIGIVENKLLKRYIFLEKK